MMEVKKEYIRMQRIKLHMLDKLIGIKKEERRMEMKKWLQIISALFLSSFVLMGCNTGQDNNDNNAPDVEENNQDNNGNNQDTNDNNVPGVDEDDTINKDDEKDNDPDPEDPVEDPEDTDKDRKDE
ncbi:hypothetical protein MOC43_18415 [Bacillus inaquosorum]|uniref:hypothetical protein n=1 Tax=Bacillus inaquosorum TaxID=483913 RepID=UPI00227E7143|nr:hypothetical protein [Bacillus inaquosorum]MCY8239108.1 hypothetical protein [Bacillus inaquosorum]